jgi:glycosyltransferase domain-containing protein
MKKKLTIILTLKDRESFTYRWMKYMNEEKCEYPIIIADGGLDLGVERTLKNNLNFENIKYEYIRYKYDENINDYYNKLVNTISMIKTDYFIFADNDDFILLNNIDTYINYLDENPEYVTCGGRILDLEIYINKQLTNQPYGDDYIVKFIQGNRSIELIEASDRVHYFFNNADKLGLWNSWYFVQRVDVVKNCLEILKSYSFKEIVIFEIFFHTFLLRIGKYKFFDSDFVLRQIGSSQVTGALLMNESLIERWLFSNAFNELNEVYIKYLKLNNHLVDRKFFTSIGKWIEGQVCLGKGPTNSVTHILRKKIYQNPFFHRIFYRIIFPHRKFYYKVDLIKRYILKN